jgi:hypothetical protein
MISPPANISTVPAVKLVLFNRSRLRNDGPSVVYRVHAEQVEAEPRNRRFDPDLARIEPVLQLAAVEQQLQGADPQAQREKSDDVERLAMDAAAVTDEDEEAKRTQQTDRQVDVEHPAPAVFLGQPAAECRPHDRPADRADAEHRHRVPVPLRWVDLQQGGLRQRDEASSSDPLQGAKRHQFAEAGGGAAQRRGDGEADDRGEEDVFDAEPAGEPAGQRHHDRGADDVRGQGPGDLVEGGRETSLNVRQGDVENRIVEPLHDVRQHDRDSDHAAVRNRGERVAPHRSPSKRKPLAGSVALCS